MSLKIGAAARIGTRFYQ